MRLELLVLCVVLFAACDVFRGGDPRPKTKLSERQFVEIYVALAQTANPEEKAEILRQHGTTQRELEAFVQAYTVNLPALSTVFDSVVARIGADGPVGDIPHIIRR